MSPITIYIALYQNQNGLQDRLREKCGFRKPIIKNEIDEIKEFVYPVSSNTDEETEKKLFHLQIPLCYQPCATRYKRNQSSRLYNVLKPYAWTDVINDAFINRYNFPCNFIYKRARVSDDTSNSKHFFTFNARCKDCKEDLFGWFDKRPKYFEPMELNILVIDTRGKENIHSTNRPLMGTKRLKISKELENNIPSNWKRQNTNNMEFGNVSPPTTYRNNVLSKVKQQFVDKQLGINKSNVIESLIEIKHNSQAGSIHSVGCDPLFVHYWTNHQLLIYKDMNKAYCRLSIDATGSLVKKIQRTSLNLLSADIFL